MFETETSKKFRDKTFERWFNITYKDAWASSTDFTCATDAMEHKIGRLIADFWMSIVGLPEGLRKIVRLLFCPRVAEFTGFGLFSEVGEPVEDREDLRRITMVRGVMMGDPLTKIILHLLNMGVRSLSEGFCEESLTKMGGLVHRYDILSTERLF
jgi:hypothetical protein